MKPVRLYIEDFMCYSNCFIDFTKFNSALIVGKVENNDMYSNGVGKTTIFKAIEYVLFNQADINLERIIRDDAASCKVVFDFLVGNTEYRVSRIRTKKSSDLSLYEKKTQDTDESTYQIIKNGVYTPISDEKYWKDISGRPASATEKELGKLIKINLKAFRSTVHFLQNDFTGLSTATPEKRKGILKESLGLLIYTKLERLAKEKSSAIAKEIDKNKILIDSLGDPLSEISKLENQFIDYTNRFNTENNRLIQLNIEKDNSNIRINDLTNAHSLLETNFASLVEREKTIRSEKNRLDSSIKEYQTKRSNLIKIAKNLTDDIKILKEEQTKLASIDYSKIDIIEGLISNCNELITKNNVSIQNNLTKFNELKIPVPNENICKHCRQELTEEHKKICSQKISQELNECQKLIKLSKKELIKYNEDLIKYQQELNSLKLSKQQLEIINTKITTKNKEIQDKRSLHDEYVSLLEKFTIELNDKDEQLNKILEELKTSSVEEAKLLNKEIIKEKLNIDNINSKLSLVNKEIAHINNTLAVVKHSIENKKEDLSKKDALSKLLGELDAKFAIYPLVLQAFSTTGIPNLIIQNILDDLQAEANDLLSQLKPGLQMSFLIEKTKDDGTQDDTLEIIYTVNGKNRVYGQLSGAMQLAVTFSLKLGLSFLLQKMIGAEMHFLLLDEIDQSLDKASVDAFSDIVKYFQKDFTILIITHNDRLKDKFSHAVLVEQNSNMVSTAEVVSNW